MVQKKQDITKLDDHARNMLESFRRTAKHCSLRDRDLTAQMYAEMLVQAGYEVRDGQLVKVEEK